VPSSTSSFDAGPTARARVFAWIAALVAAAAVLGVYEAALRARDIRPSVGDDPEMWTCIRRRASGADGRTLVLAGSSRIQGAFKPDAAREVAPDVTCVQLAVDATNPVAALRDLAEDETFRGVALMSLLPGALNRDEWESQTSWVRRRDAGWTLNDELNRTWRAALQARFSVLAPEADVRRVV
jgi:hypothetical protein